MLRILSERTLGRTHTALPHVTLAENSSKYNFVSKTRVHAQKYKDQQKDRKSVGAEELRYFGAAIHPAARLEPGPVPAATPGRQRRLLPLGALQL